VIGVIALIFALIVAVLTFESVYVAAGRSGRGARHPQLGGGRHAVHDLPDDDRVRWASG